MSVAMIEHLSNCHGEWNALIAILSSIPFIGMWMKAKLQKRQVDDKGASNGR